MRFPQQFTHTDLYRCDDRPRSVLADQVATEHQNTLRTDGEAAPAVLLETNTIPNIQLDVRLIKSWCWKHVFRVTALTNVI